MNMVSEYQGSSQQRADKKYRKKIASDDQKKSEQNMKAQYRSAKSYIRNHATVETVNELQRLLDERKEQFHAK